MPAPQEPTRLSLQEAARLVPAESLHAAEIELSNAIEHGQLPASIKRWATEQWDGRELPGNINHLDTWIERRDLETWLAAR